jgi:hypothetical protein
MSRQYGVPEVSPYNPSENKPAPLGLAPTELTPKPPQQNQQLTDPKNRPDSVANSPQIPYRDMTPGWSGNYSAEGGLEIDREPGGLSEVYSWSENSAQEALEARENQARSQADKIRQRQLPDYMRRNPDVY